MGTDTPEIRVGLLFLGRKRPGFDHDWGAAMGERVRAHLASDAEWTVFEPDAPAVDEPTLSAGMPVTLCRLWRCGDRYLMTAAAAQTTAPARHLMGTNGRARLHDRAPQAWFETLCHAGMPHHLAVFRGEHGATLRRLARALDVEWLE